MNYLVRLTYPFFILISLLLPRKKSLWVFGHYASFSDNTRYFFEYAVNKEDYQCYWLANNQLEFDEVSVFTERVVLKQSIKGYWLSSRAYLTFICTGFGDVNRLLALRSNVINFWHGTPIKKVFQEALSSKSCSLLSKIKVAIQKKVLSFLVKNTKCFYLSNTLEAELLISSSNILKSQIRVLGAPRFDFIRKCSNEVNIEKSLEGFQKIILFAPTWRSDKSWGGSFFSNKDITKFNNYLKEINAVFLIKPHPLTNKEELLSIGLKKTNNIIYSNDLGISDINYLYSFSDILVTDISSAVFDFMILGKKFVLFMPDMESYLSADREVYEYFSHELNSNAVDSMPKLLSVLKNIDEYKSGDLINRVSKEMKTYKEVCSSIFNDIQKRFYK